MRRDSIRKLQIIAQKILMFFPKHFDLYPVIRISKCSKEHKHDDIHHFMPNLFSCLQSVTVLT